MTKKPVKDKQRFMRLLERVLDIKGCYEMKP